MNKILLVSFAAIALLISSCNPNNATVNNDLKKYFDSAQADGSFSLLNNQLGDITIYNMKLDTQRISPATSFKILNTLIGVQTGKITGENMGVMTDSAAGKSVPFIKAFNQPSVSFFRALDREIGKDTLQYWIDSIGYGNKEMGNTVDSFWLDNTLQISPDEQLGFMSKLYFDQLPFQKYAQQMVRNAMLQEDNTLYKLSYATGSGLDENNHAFGWVTGWVEENRHVYFFVTLARSGDNAADMPRITVNISKKILKELGFLKGQK